MGKYAFLTRRDGIVKFLTGDRCYKRLIGRTPAAFLDYSGRLIWLMTCINLLRGRDMYSKNQRIQDKLMDKGSSVHSNPMYRPDRVLVNAMRHLFHGVLVTKND